MGGVGPVSVVVVTASGDAVARALRHAGLEVAGTVADAGAAAVLAADRSAQVVVVDLGDGPERTAAVATVADRAPGAAVLVLAAADDNTGVLAAVRAGAAGYLARPRDGAGLAAAVRRTAAGEAVFSPGLAEVVLEEYGRRGGGAQPDATPRLTEREADVLRLVVEGLTARQIAARLVLSPRTVENHIQRTLRKFRLQGRAALVRYAIEHGLA
ncbi:response regulator transcription factor [Pseudonocardia acidicola]|uniref:Response regulator transcription factor n=1 Tax=Pseudonocardia acidicola TaxID=2724939 RepID=A0ABX1SGL1_9PSEU|nr:response regulator transcription factor [Pseudonocardia acidicola]NMI00705.1 response regulator transcription factor [Pseudonocardia acidicola]